MSKHEQREAAYQERQRQKEEHEAIEREWRSKIMAEETADGIAVNPTGTEKMIERRIAFLNLYPWNERQVSETKFVEHTLSFVPLEGQKRKAAEVAPYGHYMRSELPRLLRTAKTEEDKEKYGDLVEKEKVAIWRHVKRWTDGKVPEK